MGVPFESTNSKGTNFERSMWLLRLTFSDTETARSVYTVANSVHAYTTGEKKSMHALAKAETNLKSATGSACFILNLYMLHEIH